jgi:UDP:flavonoid glycosyltransferase YjiC (YdhE family)
VPFADHDEVMPSCTAVVTHGGLGTVLHALAHGVPMLLLPLGRDQHANAARVASLGAGIVLDARADVGAALETLLAEPRFTAAATRAAERIAADEPDRRAAEALERLL